MQYYNAIKIHVNIEAGMHIDKLHKYYTFHVYRK